MLETQNPKVIPISFMAHCRQEGEVVLPSQRAGSVVLSCSLVLSGNFTHAVRQGRDERSYGSYFEALVRFDARH